MPPPPKGSIESYASRLAQLIHDELGVELPSNFEGIFRFHAEKVGPSNYEDLGSWVLLECLEEKRRGELDAKAVIRAVDRIRHRITRMTKREVKAIAEPPNRGPAAKSPWQEVSDFLSSANSELSPLEVLVFQRHFLEGETIASLATELGLSLTKAYKVRNEVRLKFGQFVKDNVARQG
jgi:hypothetical protein